MPCQRVQQHTTASTSLESSIPILVPQISLTSDRSPGGGYPGAQGEPSKPNNDIDFFVDEIIANGFINPVAMSFTDNSNELYVGERGGRVWYVNLETGRKLSCFFPQMLTSSRATRFR